MIWKSVLNRISDARLNPPDIADAEPHIYDVTLTVRVEALSEEGAAIQVFDEVSGDVDRVFVELVE
jgi:hypothetical protein